MYFFIYLLFFFDKVSLNTYHGNGGKLGFRKELKLTKRKNQREKKRMLDASEPAPIEGEKKKFYTRISPPSRIVKSHTKQKRALYSGHNRKKLLTSFFFFGQNQNALSRFHLPLRQ